MRNIGKKNVFSLPAVGISFSSIIFTVLKAYFSRNAWTLSCWIAESKMLQQRFSISFECRGITMTKHYISQSQKSKLFNKSIEPNARSRYKTWENVFKHLGFNDCLKRWHEIFKPIAKRGNAKPKEMQVTFRHESGNRSKIFTDERPLVFGLKRVIKHGKLSRFL